MSNSSSQMYLYQFLKEPLFRSGDVEKIDKCKLEDALLYSRLFEVGLDSAVLPKETELMKIISVSEDDISDSSDIKSKLDDEQTSIEGSFLFTSIGDNMVTRMGKNIYYAPYPCVFYMENGAPQILKVNNNGAYSLNVSDNQMLVTLDIYPPGPNGQSLKLEEIVKEIREIGINVELNKKAIESGIKESTNYREPMYNIKIAEGKPAVNGKDGWLELFVNLSTSDGLKTTEDGRTDFYNRDNVVPVEKGQEIAEYHPHKPGVDGHDVYMHIVPAKKGRPYEFSPIENTVPHPDKKNLFISRIDGIVSKIRNSYVISQIFNVKDDVNIKTGNINTKGSINIGGDIRNRLRVSAAHDIRIGGCVEDAEVIAGGDVWVRRGFIGQGNGIIRSAGDVNVHFIRHQTIYSRSSIHIYNEAIESKLYAGDSIFISGKKVSIVGGYAMAKNLIEVENLGNEYNVPTTVEVGYDFMLDVEIKKMLKEFEDRKSKVDQVSVLLHKLKAQTLDDEQKQSLKLLTEQEAKLEFEAKQVEKKMKKLEAQKWQKTNARVRVNKYVFPGSKVIINKRKFIVNEEMKGKTFLLTKDEELVAI